MVPPADFDALSTADLKALVIALLGKVTELERTVAAQRDEIARLKGLKGRPTIKPSGMEKATEPRALKRVVGKRRRKRAKSADLTIHEERIIKAGPVPPGSRFKGYETFLVQDLVLHPHVIRFRRERWLAPDGTTLTAPLPGRLSGHFGPGLRRFVLAQHHQGQVTVPRLVAQLRAIGIQISKRQVMRLLNEGQDAFLAEARAVLHAGLASAAWITVDDTGARHKGRNGTCTQIGNDHFTWFGTTATKTRLNFLELLRAGHTDYRIDAEALAYMRQRALAGPIIDVLAAHADQHFADAAAWMRHLERLGLTDLKANPDPVRIASEGAVWGAIKAHGLLPNTVIVSDDAGQFMVGRHALCWVHAERLIHRLDTFTDHQRTAQQQIRRLIWWFYRDLKAYRREPSARRRAELKARFGRIFRRRTGFVVLDRLLQRLHANKAELLMVLKRPEIPLHTNGSENDIRAQVTRRKISGGTRSDAGRDGRDAFLGLMKTCQKLGLSFWDYLGARLAIADAPAVPRLPDLVRARCAPA
jgi:Transposase IS66 family